jgi:hypothetical protein
MKIPDINGTIGLDVNPIQSVTGLTKIDLGTLWNMAFGYKGLPFLMPYVKQGNYLYNEYDMLQREAAYLPTKKEADNGKAPVYTSDPSNSNKLLFLPIWINDTLIPVARVWGGCKKVIVETPLIARRGTVKELIRFDDYRFTIQGFCVGLKKEYPESQIEQINRYFNMQEPVKVKNAFIDTVAQTEDFIIEDINFPDMRGVEHVKAFEMKITADSIFDLNEV